VIVDTFTYAIYFLYAQVLLALAKPTRLMILDYLQSGEKSLRECAELLRLPDATVYRHLEDLSAQGIITTRCDGKMILYSLGDPRIVHACDLLYGFLADREAGNRAFASHLPRARRLRGVRAAVPRQ
jgi:DNA-binding transcriptional ArsR family regulator